VPPDANCGGLRNRVSAVLFQQSIPGILRGPGNPEIQRAVGGACTWESVSVSGHSPNDLQPDRSVGGIARDGAEFLATPPAPRVSHQEVQKNRPTRTAAMQPHCRSVMRSRSTSAAKASVTSG
jgi:hypothetical protein